MNHLKRLLGIVWIGLAIAAAYYGFNILGYPKLTSGRQEDVVFGFIIVFILLPIVVGGLLLFGRYSYNGEYDSKKT